VSGGVENLFKSLFGGGAPAVTPIAQGGVVAAPSYFPLGRGLGLTGEQGLVRFQRTLFDWMLYGIR
jgi:hypothetical protein